MRDNKLLNGMILFTILLNVMLFFLMKATNLPWADFDGHWRICAYTLRGVDAYQQIGVNPPIFEDIGIIPIGWGTSPWGMLLGNLFYPGYMSFEIAGKYFFILNIVILLITATIFYFKAAKISQTLGIFATVFFIFSASFGIPLTCGNAGGMICCLLLICCVCYEDFPILSGILLSIAMIKPQAALPICFALLLQKRFKVLITAAAIDLSALLIVSILIQKAPWTIINEFLHSNIGSGGQFAGIFQLAFENTNTAMAASMLAGLIFVYILHTILRRKNLGIFTMYPACIASSFWCYSFFSELYILLLPVLFCLNIMLQTKERLKKFLWFTAALYSQIALSFWVTIIIFFRQNESLQPNLNVFQKVVEISFDHYAHTFFLIGVIIIGFLICIHCKSESRFNSKY